MATVIESCQISPASDGLREISLPLTFFDTAWLLFRPIQRLLFYDLACSKSEFLATHLPNLKKSLSVTLKHYTPLAGKLLCPSIGSHEKPRIHYAVGDSVPLEIFESADDFGGLVGHNPRDADQFYDYVARLGPIRDESDYRIVPFLAIRLTLFEGKGVCIGFTNHHTVGDGNSIVRFIKAWASISKLDGSDEELLSQGHKYSPCFDRNLIKDPLGLDTIFWNEIKELPLKDSIFPLPTNRVRATFVLRKAEIKKLRDLVLANRPNHGNLSTFTVVSAYVWTNFVKSGTEIGEPVDEDVLEYFVFSVDARARLDPQVPENYFGNCLSYGMSKIKHFELIGADGFVLAAEATAEDIRNRVNNKEEVLKGAENWMAAWKKFSGVSVIGVSGSPRFGLYDTDFGWGRARKTEVVSIDAEQWSMSLFESRDSEGGVEIGLSLPRERMEAFAALFHGGLKES